ncbi:MAG TPA: alkaline phosphatase family protein [Acidimicrobiales bacterium]|jgi:phospholipase C|nr:alkaline phosphatase family protein [Acidimicrobiales bacterium]
MQESMDRWSGRRHLRHRRAQPGDRPDSAQPPGTDRVPAISHVVILMMENHSFDNYLGTLGRGDGLADSAPSNLTSTGQKVTPFRLSTTEQPKGVPSQSWQAAHIQYGDGTNDGFVHAVEQLTPEADPALAMGHWTEEDLPFYAGLGRTFPLADRWFSSCLGPTFPNRRFLMAGTANGLMDDEIAGVIDYPPNGTVFDLLNRHGIMWANYHHVPHRRLYGRRIGGMGAMHVGRRGRLLTRHLLPGAARQIRGEVQCTANLYALGLFRTLRHLRSIDRFFDDAAAGTLPPVSIVDPDFQSCSEENPQDIQMGEGFAAAVINAVMHGPGWPGTLLIWLYDEHGGYYDHVPPPPAVEPDDVLPHGLGERAGVLGWLLRHSVPGHRPSRADAPHGRYDRYGFRVPAVIISPYAKPDFVSSTVYDHTSVLKLIEEKWNLPFLTCRDAEATAPWEMLDLNGPPAFLRPPDLPSPARPWPVWAPDRRRHQGATRRTRAVRLRRPRPRSVGPVGCRAPGTD